ncbi:Phytochelatin synthase-domain-containing protein [Dunaliella salina]|uniref:glutathione gamma-glutamylcysteinyltransferase n=1 Tax=Dunaliella salina TaxID=3046 RepID=A0ABQ7G0Y0_DUNSA|nr:Phytochelatin synthase-domain-containing protein [Dunaliella salina]|eukprot:KAF5828256.1 Phytochelatin synthase-domain-containing protein [Dunaliella salina]
MLGLIWRAYVSPLRTLCPYSATQTFSNATASAKQRKVHAHGEHAATLQHTQHEIYNWQWIGPHGSPGPKGHGQETSAAAQTHSTVPPQQAPQPEPVPQQADSATGATTTCEQEAKAVGGYKTGVTTWPSGTGFKKTFYKRTLPSPPATAFASEEGRKLFAEALAAGHTNGFFKLMEQFSTQDEPAFCGLASLAMVLNALAIDPRRTWKGSWRWFHEQMLDCCRPLEDVRKAGITLTHAACLSRCNGARVDLHRYGTFTLEDLRRQVLEVCSTGEDHLVVSYSRRTFGQTGDGHFSPIGGYHQGKDLVLILDVARFKYPPHWVPLPMLYEAMQYVDPATSQPRGFLRMSAHPLQGSVLLTLDVRSAGAWQAAHAFARTGARMALQNHLVSSTQSSSGASSSSNLVETAVAALLQQLPIESANAFLVVRQQHPQQSSHVCSSGSSSSSSSSSSAPLSTSVSGSDSSSSSSSSSSGSSSSGGSHQQNSHLIRDPSSSEHHCCYASREAERTSTGRSADGNGTGSSSSSSSSSLPSATSGSLGETSASGSHLHNSNGGMDSAETSRSSRGDLSNNRGDISCTNELESGSSGSSSRSRSGSHDDSSTCNSRSSGRSSDGEGSSGSSGGNSAGGAARSLLEASTEDNERCVPHQARAQLLGELHATPLYQMVLHHMQQLGLCQGTNWDTACEQAHPSTNGGARSNTAVGTTHTDAGAAAALPGVPPSPGYLAEKAAVLLLLQTPAQWGVQWPDQETAEQWASLMDVSAYSILDAELAFLREQWRHIADLDGMYGPPQTP